MEDDIGVAEPTLELPTDRWRDVLREFHRATGQIAAQTPQSLAQVERGSREAYFSVLSDGGDSPKEIALRMGVSFRKMAGIRADRNRALQLDDEVRLQRQIERAVWDNPKTLSEIENAFSSERLLAVRAAVKVLQEQERIGQALSAESTRKRGRFARWTGQRSRLADDTRWLAMVDSLRQLLATVSRTVTAQFLPPTPTPGHVFRNLAFKIRAQDIEALRSLYEKQIFPAVEALEAQAAGDPDALRVDLSVLWSVEQQTPASSNEAG
ncbi:MAG: hypothetical protein ACI9OJ_004033 [Myxococcota bacterium]|jgi:hypothetical protein